MITLSEGMVTGITASVCTALPILFGMWLRHREAMRKQDAEDLAAAERRKVEAHERELARINLARDLQRINSRTTQLADRQVQIDAHLQTNTMKVEELLQMTVRNSQLGNLGGK